MKEFNRMYFGETGTSNLEKFGYYRFKPLVYVGREFPEVPDGTEMFASYGLNIDAVRKDIQAGKFAIIEADVQKIRRDINGEISLMDCQNLDFSWPIVFAELTPFDLHLIDGNHRCVKAQADGIKTLKAVVIRAEELVDYFARKSFYQGFVDNWNRRVKTVEESKFYPEILNGGIAPRAVSYPDEVNAYAKLTAFMQFHRRIEVQSKRGWFSVSSGDSGKLYGSAATEMTPSIKCARPFHIRDLDGISHSRKTELEALRQQFC